MTMTCRAPSPATSSSHRGTEAQRQVCIVCNGAGIKNTGVLTQLDPERSYQAGGAELLDPNIPAVGNPTVEPPSLGTLRVRQNPQCCGARDLCHPTWMQGQCRPGWLVKAFAIKGAGRGSLSEGLNPCRPSTTLKPQLGDPHTPLGVDGTLQVSAGLRHCPRAWRVPGSPRTLGGSLGTGPGESRSQLCPCRVPTSEPMELPRLPLPSGPGGNAALCSQALGFSGRAGYLAYLWRLYPLNCGKGFRDSRSCVGGGQLMVGGAHRRGWELGAPNPGLLPGRSRVLGPDTQQVREALRKASLGL